MTKIKESIKRMCLKIGVLSLIFTAPHLAANTYIDFHDVTSTVMMNSLESLPKNNFLRKRYTQLFFVPVWAQEEKLSPLSKSLFSEIEKDKTLLESSRLKHGARSLAELAESICTPNGSLKQKVKLEFKIAQLYKGYEDYRFYGSINCAFSHGCIRLHKPRELLKTFSTLNETVYFEKAQERLKGEKKAYLTLTEQVPVDVVYLATYVDYDGVLQFGNDAYGYDKMQLQPYRQW